MSRSAPATLIEIHETATFFGTHNHTPGSGFVFNNGLFQGYDMSVGVTDPFIGDVYTHDLLLYGADCQEKYKFGAGADALHYLDNLRLYEKFTKNGVTTSESDAAAGAAYQNVFIGSSELSFWAGAANNWTHDMTVKLMGIAIPWGSFSQEWIGDDGNFARMQKGPGHLMCSAKGGDGPLGHVALAKIAVGIVPPSKGSYFLKALDVLGNPVSKPMYVCILPVYAQATGIADVEYDPYLIEGMTNTNISWDLPWTIPREVRLASAVGGVDSPYNYDVKQRVYSVGNIVQPVLSARAFGDPYTSKLLDLHWPALGAVPARQFVRTRFHPTAGLGPKVRAKIYLPPTKNISQSEGWHQGATNNGTHLFNAGSGLHQFTLYPGPSGLNPLETRPYRYVVIDYDSVTPNSFELSFTWAFSNGATAASKTYSAALGVGPGQIVIDLANPSKINFKDKTFMSLVDETNRGRTQQIPSPSPAVDMRYACLGYVNQLSLTCTGPIDFTITGINLVANKAELSHMITDSPPHGTLSTHAMWGRVDDLFAFDFRVDSGAAGYPGEPYFSDQAVGGHNCVRTFQDLTKDANVDPALTKFTIAVVDSNDNPIPTANCFGPDHEASIWCSADGKGATFYWFFGTSTMFDGVGIWRGDVLLGSVVVGHSVPSPTTLRVDGTVIVQDFKTRPHADDGLFRTALPVPAVKINQQFFYCPTHPLPQTKIQVMESGQQSTLDWGCFGFLNTALNVSIHEHPSGQAVRAWINSSNKVVTGTSNLNDPKNYSDTVAGIDAKWVAIRYMSLEDERRIILAVQTPADSIDIYRSDDAGHTWTVAINVGPGKYPALTAQKHGGFILGCVESGSAKVRLYDSNIVLVRGPVVAVGTVDDAGLAMIDRISNQPVANTWRVEMATVESNSVVLRTSTDGLTYS